MEANPRTGGDLWTLTLDGKAAPLLATSAQERDPRLSPDGRWLAYQSNTAGRDDVYIASFSSLAAVQPAAPARLENEAEYNPRFTDRLRHTGAV